MSAVPKQPNVLVFIPHDLGDTLHCYGHEAVRSPNLDRLAGRGVRFSNYFAASPECSPSRGAMMTGFPPHQNGMMGLANFGWRLCKPHLAQRLSELGYATHLFGTQHETQGSPEGLGYGEIHAQTRPAGAHGNVKTVCSEVCAFMRDGAAPADDPWFACAGFQEVHRPWPPETSFTPKAVRVPAFLPDNSTIRKDLTEFYQNIEDMDTAVGSVLDTLDTSRYADNTLVIFTTDHGPAFPRAKATLYEPGLRIPLIMHWPGHIEGGEVLDELIGNVQFSPTLLDIMGVELRGPLQGRSFAPLLRGERYEPPEQVVTSLLYDVAYDPMHAVRTRTHKYIRSFAVTPEEAAGADPDVLATHVAGQWIRVDDYDVMSSPAWESMAAEQAKPPREELYDLRDDPWEQSNLAEDPAAAEVLTAMRGRLHDWMVASNSPLLKGHVPPPDKQREATKRYRPGGPMYGARKEQG